jgi:UPF0271 protein
MGRILLNADIGERGSGHAGDLELMRFIDIANIACGGHAGDSATTGAFVDLADRLGVQVSAHLSYPDRENFGRVSVPMVWKDLQFSLQQQMSLMPDAGMIKLHGALYNDSCADAELAQHLADWFVSEGVRRVVTMPGSELDIVCGRLGITVLHEVFAERRHVFMARERRLLLMSRGKPGASIASCAEAFEQVRSIVNHGRIPAVVEDGDPRGGMTMCNVAADTICIHSDSSIAIELAHLASGLLREHQNGKG